MQKAASIDDLPRSAVVFPLGGALLLPHTSRPLNVYEPRYVAMIDAALGDGRMIVMVQPRNTSEESPKGNVALLGIGCLGRIVHFEETSDARYLIILEGICRVRLGAEETVETPFRRFAIDPTPYASDFDPRLGEEAVDRERFIEAITAYADFAGFEIDWDEVNEADTADLVNISAMLAPFGAAERQLLLESPTLKTRAETLMAIAELEMARAKTGHTLQ